MRMHVLGQRFALPLQQTMSCLSSFELIVHQAQRLSRRENGLPILRMMDALEVALSDLLELRHVPP